MMRVLTTVVLLSLVFYHTLCSFCFWKITRTCYLPSLVIVVDSSTNHVCQGHHRQRLHFHGPARPGMPLFLEYCFTGIVEGTLKRLGELVGVGVGEEVS